MIAKPLPMFGHGICCGRSPNNASNLTGFGYPSHPLEGYRGGLRNGSNCGSKTARQAG